jgi:hypothetical protein
LLDNPRITREEDAMFARHSRPCPPTCNDNGGFLQASAAYPLGVLKIATKLGGPILLTYVADGVAVIQALRGADTRGAA